MNVFSTLKAAGAAIAFSVALNASVLAAGDGQKLHVVILSGRNNHDWVHTTPVLKELFEKSPHFAVSAVVDDPKTCTAATFRDVDVVVSNWSAHPDMTGQRWGDAAEKSLTDFVRGGKGFVVVHAANATSHDWPEFQQLIGLTWKMNYTAHGIYGNFKVTMRDKEHPIARGMPEFWTTDELYYKLVSLSQQDFHVVSDAFSGGDMNGSGQFEPALVCTKLGNGRGVNLVLGHDAAAMQNVGFRTLMLRGAEWAATGQVTIPIPADWPNTSAAASVTGIDPETALATAAGYRFGQSRTPLFIVEQLVNHATSLSGDAGEARRAALSAGMGKLLAEREMAPEARSFFCTELGQIGTKKQVAVIASLLSVEQVSMAACGALERIPGEEASTSLREALKKASGRMKVGIINSLGRRGELEASGDLVPLLNEDAGEVRSAAVAALGRIGGNQAARGLSQLLGKVSDSERSPVVDACLACAEKSLAEGATSTAAAMFERLFSGDEMSRTKAAALRGLVLCDRQKAPKLLADALGGKTELVQAMAVQMVQENVELGGLTLTELRTRVKSSDDSISKVATQALFRWPTRAAIDDLIELASNSDCQTCKLSAMQAAIRLVGEAGPATQQLDHQIEQIWAVTSRAEEKNALLSQLGQHPSAAGLRLAAGALADSAVAERAGEAIARIAPAIESDADRSEAASTLWSLLSTSKADVLQKRAFDGLRQMGQLANLARDATASSPDDLDPDGASGPDQAAIDGNPATYWDEQDDQKLYRFKVTFPQAVEVSAIILKGHAYHVHSPKDFEILCDDRVVKQVTGAQYEQASNEALICFPVTSCRSLELRITGYYPRSPGIREIEIYSLAPAPRPAR